MIRSRAPFVLLIVLLGACGATANSPDTAVGQGDTSLAAASAGVCAAIAALPDPDEANREFMNRAHAVLHQLAADPGLDRPGAAAVLESMQEVELDFAQGADAGSLLVHLTALQTATDSALRDLDLEVPPCTAS